MPPPPPPPWYEPAPTPAGWLPPSSPYEYGSILYLVVALALCLFGLFVCCGHRNSRDRAAAAARAPAARLPRVEPSRHYYQELRRLRRTRAAARLPAFKYCRLVKHTVTTTSGGEDAAATCSVCLGVFQFGETERLLPVCLHLYHVECIDPWLDAHSTCPICRSGTDPAMDVAGGLPPV